MSLDVYLEGQEYEADCTCTECWQTHKTKRRDTFYDANITHNLGAMARAAGIYEHLWRPEEIGVTTASQLIGPLTDGIERLESDEVGMRKHDSPNGWGLYEHFVPFVRNYLEACKQHPDAFVRASR